MKAKLDLKKLRSAWSTLANIVPARAAMPIVQNVLLVLQDNKLTLEATDTEVWASQELAVDQAYRNGKLLLPASRVASIMRESTSSWIEIDATSAKVSLTLDGSTFELPTEDAGAFPSKSIAGQLAQEVTLRASTLASMLGSVSFCVATDEGKYAMRGVYLECDGQKATAAGTDGKRLAVYEGPIASNVSTKIHALIPKKSAQLAERLLESAETDVTIRFYKANETATCVEVLAPEFSLSTRLVDGRFPPFREVFPSKRVSSCKLAMEPFEHAVRAASIMADVESKRAQIEFSGQVLIRCEGAATGKSAVQHQPLGYEGKPFSIAIDPQYLIEGMRVGASILPEADLHLLSADKPVVFSAGPWKYLVVPLT